ncbi:MAG: Fic family protein [Oligoflexia bacterium]|nr:Fic family protein [Oligoflexia bacterium]
MPKYLWQHPSWPNFELDQDAIFKVLLEAKKSQAFILAQANLLELNDQMEFFIEEAYTTSAIEGEILDRETIRSSVAKRLGLETAGMPQIKRESDGLVEVLMDATTNHQQELTHERLFSWHAALFPTTSYSGYSGINKILVGEYRQGEDPMQVISGRIGKERIHYEAPPSNRDRKEMNRFLKWWNTSDNEYDGIIRAAIAHLWFVTIHPFDDGNGRIARAITDMALAKEEKICKRLYSLSFQILRDKKNYYEILERTQKGNGEITDWILWFISMFIQSIDNSKKVIEKSIFIARFYKKFADKIFNERQWKVIKKLLECLPEDFTGGLTNKKYVSMTGVSAESAKRDLRDLVAQGVLLVNEKKGRSTSYRLNKNFRNDE